MVSPPKAGSGSETRKVLKLIPGDLLRNCYTMCMGGAVHVLALLLMPANRQKLVLR